MLGCTWSVVPLSSRREPSVKRDGVTVLKFSRMPLELSSKPLSVNIDKFPVLLSTLRSPHDCVDPSVEPRSVDIVAPRSGSA